MDQWRAIANPAHWGVTPVTQRLLKHWRQHEFAGLRPLPGRGGRDGDLLTEIATQSNNRAGKRFLEHLTAANDDANPGLVEVAGGRSPRALADAADQLPYLAPDPSPTGPTPPRRADGGGDRQALRLYHAPGQGARVPGGHRHGVRRLGRPPPVADRERRRRGGPRGGLRHRAAPPLRGVHAGAGAPAGDRGGSGSEFLEDLEQWPDQDVRLSGRIRSIWPAPGRASPPHASTPAYSRSTSSTLSISASVWSALTWNRISSSPRGTTGKARPVARMSWS